MSTSQKNTKKSEIVLSIRNLKVNFYTYEGVVKALDGITFDVYEGETLGLVGETGCGKSVTVRSILRLIEEPGKIVEGEILYRGKDVLKMESDELLKLRGGKISMIFQDPMTFLNPVLKVGLQVAEVVYMHGLTPKEQENLSFKSPQVKERVIKLFEMVRLPNPEQIYDRYPHELSGGMRQRVLIAMAIAAEPDIIIADEATTALDVTIQAQILELLNELKKKLKTTLIFVTHNLGLVAETCDRVAVLYGGQICEIASTRELFKKPQHPYTEGLLKAVPRLYEQQDYLDSIPGVVPNLVHPPSGCRFHPRCPIAEEICKKERPLVKEITEGHYVSCHVRTRDKIVLSQHS